MSTSRTARTRTSLISLLLAACAELASPTGLGASLYEQRVEGVVPTGELIQKSEERVRDHKDIPAREHLAVPPFHKQLEPPLRQGETFCQTCHAPFPHTKQLRDRSFLNMHTRFIACETCHFRPNDVAIEYRWTDFAQQVAAPPHSERFRSGRKLDNAVLRDGGVKIAPWFDGMPAVAFKQSLFGERVATAWREPATPLGEKVQLRARLHIPLEKKGPECAACHREIEPLLDLAALGATDEQSLAIRRHVIPQFFGRYQSDDARLKIIDILR